MNKMKKMFIGILLTCSCQTALVGSINSLDLLSFLDNPDENVIGGPLPVLTDRKPYPGNIIGEQLPPVPDRKRYPGNVSPKTLPVVTDRYHHQNTYKMESKDKSDGKARQILLQNIQQSANNNKAQPKEFIEMDDDWRETIIAVWDWFVSGMRRVANGMANLATQLMTS